LYVEYQDVLTRPEHLNGTSTAEDIEKIAALLTEDYLEQEAKQGRREDFEKVMKAVPSTEPEEYDRLK